MALHRRIIPLIVACPLFLQNLDTSIMATALPSIADSLHLETLRLNLAITSYLLSLAVFLPASGWLADRFGARRVFCWAIVLFSLGSTLCGLANNLPELVVFRILQGMGGAMMVPVGRLILLRSVPSAELIAAMVWFTVPGAFGRLAGPMLGGLIVTFVSWRWIFLLNIPFGVLGVVMARIFIAKDGPEATLDPFDHRGFVLSAAGLVGLVGGFETAGKGLLPGAATLLMIAFGALALWVFERSSREHSTPIINLRLLKFPTYRTGVLGGMPLRIAIGASPFLLPLMFQLGFGLSPLLSGFLSLAPAVGSLSTRALIAGAIKRIGFRWLLVSATGLTAAFYASYGLFRPTTSHVLIFVVLLLGGLFNSAAMVTLNTLGYSDIPAPSMSRATALAGMAQQLSISMGVAFASTLVTGAAWLHGASADHLSARDFSPAFVVVGAVTLISVWSFLKLTEASGANLRAK
ncbi:MFS transporter [Burkholderia sp. L27(2015)]|uniref:MFS transporter n=1 Tax=Burkholderia sp. L27(2015) TaxID=1641858 RepID=UPI00131AD179|nr:MFS transporter [Burkholderia sp. L27(2015)]